MTLTDFRQGLAKRFAILTVLFLVATVFAALAAQHWFLELFSHFTPHYFVFALFCMLGLVLLRMWRWAAKGCRAPISAMTKVGARRGFIFWSSTPSRA